MNGIVIFLAGVGPYRLILPASGRRLDELIPVAPAVTVAESQPGLMVTRGLPFSSTLLTDRIDTTNGYSFEKPGSQ